MLLAGTGNPKCDKYIEMLTAFKKVNLPAILDSVKKQIFLLATNPKSLVIGLSVNHYQLSQ
ncbi:MAG: hypothetical protein HOO91_19380 [Bacteroidales bacterium]|nr:hypothetical protein [Bacteroidales bacterium]